MEISALKAVSLVEQAGSIAGAARILDMDASSVSRIVSNLERELGFRLFQRTTRRLTPTEAGESYLRQVRPLLEELDAAREQAHQASVAPRGVLRMTASVAFSDEVIVPLLPEFYSRYPEIGVELLSSDANLDLLDAGIDLAIRLAASPEGDLISSRLMATRYRVVASPEYVAQSGGLRSPADLSGRDCLRFALPDFRSRWLFRQGEGEVLPIKVAGTTLLSNALALRRAARMGMGPALLADWLIARDLASGRLVDLLPEWDCAATEFDTGACVLYPSRAYLPQKVRVMIDFLRHRLRRGVAGLDDPMGA